MSRAITKLRRKTVNRENIKGRHVDLFSGIGGFSLAVNPWYDAVMFCEKDHHARRLLTRNMKVDWSVTPIFERVEDLDELPECDLLTAGFPCQPFSRARKGEASFNDLDTYLALERLLGNSPAPKMMLLENVPGLLTHDSGFSYRYIYNGLKRKHDVFPIMACSNSFVPQVRNRLFFCCFPKGVVKDFDPVFPSDRPLLGSILEESVHEKYTISKELWAFFSSKDKYKPGVVYPDEQTRTLTSHYHKDGAEILLMQEGGIPRRLTPRECARLMGFSDDFVLNVSDARAWACLGNSVVVALVRSIVKQMRQAIDNSKKAK
jgi:DNA (cytosine-5)-methyltransferase 1